jgi:hypothetical protein
MWRIALKIVKHRKIDQARASLGLRLRSRQFMISISGLILTLKMEDLLGKRSTLILI